MLITGKPAMPLTSGIIKLLVRSIDEISCSVARRSRLPPFCQLGPPMSRVALPTFCLNLASPPATGLRMVLCSGRVLHPGHSSPAAG